MYATHIKNEGFIRFTVAHELGHYFLPGHPETLFPDGHGTHASRSGFVSRGPIEEEADHFAATLLMPEALFVAASNDADVGFAAIDSLATQCKTSITATAIRYATYAESAVAVVVSSGRNID
jgi:Zn-dependent peptidase ImmA (M78 family)